MSVKLSELLEEAAGALLSCASFCEEYGNKNGQREAEHASTLLCAIAPALVGVIAELQHHAEHGWHDHCDKTMCRACVLASAMKAAGVTCE